MDVTSYLIRALCYLLALAPVGVRVAPRSPALSDDWLQAMRYYGWLTASQV